MAKPKLWFGVAAVLFALHVNCYSSSGSLKLNDFTLSLGTGMSIAFSRGSITGLTDQESKFRLSFTEANETGFTWWFLKFELDVTADCATSPLSLHLPVTISDIPLKNGESNEDVRLSSIQSSLNACVIKTQKEIFLGARGEDWDIDGLTGQRLDLKRQRASAQSEYEAQEEARRKELAAAGKRRRQRDEQERRAQAEAEEQAAARTAKARSACAAIYKLTADKKIGDLTVNEEQQVRACQTLGYYAPAK